MNPTTRNNIDVVGSGDPKDREKGEDTNLDSTLGGSVTGGKMAEFVLPCKLLGRGVGDGHQVVKKENCCGEHMR